MGCHGAGQLIGYAVSANSDFDFAIIQKEKLWNVVITI